MTNMYKILSNASKTRHIEVSEAHLETIRKYSLFAHLIDSSGIIDEEVLDKLKFNIRGLLESETTKDNALLDLCLDVIYNQNMKSLGLKNLIKLYTEWQDIAVGQDEMDDKHNLKK